MRHCWVVVFALVVACSNSTAPEAASGSAQAPVVPATGSGGAEVTAETLIASMVDYVVTLASVPFTGDCDAWVKEALKVEPLKTRIEEQMTALRDSPDRDAIATALQTRGPAEAEAALAAKGTSMAAYEANEEKVHTACRGTASYEEAMPRIAMKRRR